MYTALDIQNKEFSKGIRGYDEEEVDLFLDELIVDYQGLIDKNAAQENEIQELKSKLAEYKSTEGTVIKTLESAKSLMNDIAQSAEKRADMLIKNAELEASNKTKQAEEDVKRLAAEKTQLESAVKNLKLKMKGLLEAELNRLNLLDGEEDKA